MSIELITGIPSSGKSYFASSKMLEIYNSKNRLIYTNVNLRISYDDYIQALDVPDLYKFATLEFELFNKFTKLSNDYKSKHEEDISLLGDDESFNDDPFKEYYGNYDKYLKDSNILDTYGGSYIVWDECHNDLQGDGVASRADPIWVRFFSYHRHFNIDIILITQDISLLHRKYKPFIAKYYFGQNPAKRFTTKTLKFKIYTDAREFEKFYIETIQVPMKKEVFAFYDSGEYNPDKSLLFKKLLPAIILILFVSAFFIYFFNSKETVTHQEQKNVTLQHNKKDTNSTNDDYEDKEDYHRDSDEHIIFFTCNTVTCSMKNSSFVVPLDDINTFADAMGMKILYSSRINVYYRLVAVSVNESLYNDLMKFEIQKRGDKHENGKMDFTAPINKF